MQFQGQYQRSLTIPTGATSGARIVIDGNAGTISVYNASNQLVTLIGGSDGSLTVFGSTVFAKLVSGAIQLGQIVNGAPDTANAGQMLAVSGAPGDLIIESAVDPGIPSNDRASIGLFGGAQNQKTGSTGNPTIQVFDTAGNSDVDINLSGTVIQNQDVPIPYSWTEPPLNAGWDTAAIRSGRPFQVRRDAQNNVVLTGSLDTTSTTPANPICNVGFTFSSNQSFVVVHQNSGGSLVNMCVGFVTTTGQLEIFSAGSIAVGDIFTFNATLPIGTIP